MISQAQRIVKQVSLRAVQGEASSAPFRKSFLVVFVPQYYNPKKILERRRKRVPMVKLSLHVRKSFPVG